MAHGAPAGMLKLDRASNHGPDAPLPTCLFARRDDAAGGAHYDTNNMKARWTTRMARRLISSLVLLAAAGAHAQPAPKKPATPPTPAPATNEQLAAAAMTHFGAYTCEFKQSLQLSRDPRVDGYVDLLFGKRVYVMKPVLSGTGALRLEDVRGRVLLLQIPVKSMLLDAHTGRRLVDACVHETQAENQRRVDAAPPQPGLGIDPVRAAADAAAATAEAASAAAKPPAEPAAATGSAPTK
jgi:hypothetical protein